jgi:hypothetical protein
MSRMIMFASVLAVLMTAGSVTAFKLTHRPALAAQPIDPAMLHVQLRKAQDEMALP